MASRDRGGSTFRARAGSVLVVLLALMPVPIAVGPWHLEIGMAAVEPPPMARVPEGYRTRQIEGWQVWINGGFLSGQPELADRTLRLLGFQLYQITRVVPRDALAKLRAIRIWVEENEPHHPCMAYHPDPRWLIDHGMNPEKARCVELANARTFLVWTIHQPWMLLHELAHGYHHQFLEGGYDNAEIKATYDRALKDRLYDRVLRYGGQEEKAYAATNPMEYFAEASEAYFGTNDFFPFVRIELRRHDPRAFELLESLWGVNPAAARKRPATRKTPRTRPSGG